METKESKHEARRADGRKSLAFVALGTAAPLNRLEVVNRSLTRQRQLGTHLYAARLGTQFEAKDRTRS